MKQRLLWLLPLVAITLSGCATETEIAYSDDEPLLLSLAAPHLRVMQVTDLHLTYGFDRNDQRSYELIEALALETEPDLIILTGDNTMSPLAPSLYAQFTRRMEKIGLPWTFVFGNHDSDFNPYKRNLDAIEEVTTEHMLFKNGPELLDGGIGNIMITATYEEQPFHKLYLLDSKNEDGGLNEYDWLSDEQVSWYGGHAASDALIDLTSTVYMHTPLIQFEDYVNHDLIDGAMGEDKVYSQGQESGFFDAMVLHGVSKGVFSGHDHLSNFSFLKDGIMLAYGQTSGYNGYGAIARGARIIDIDETGALTSFLITDAEVGV